MDLKLYANSEIFLQKIRPLSTEVRGLRSNLQILLNVPTEKKEYIFSSEENNIHTVMLQEIPHWSSSLA